MEQVKRDDIIEEISKNGLFVHVMANFREIICGRNYWNTKHRYIHVSIPLDVASRLLDLLSIRKDYLKINLKDTKLFKSSEIWKMLDWTEFKKPKMSLVLVRDPMRYENVVERRQKKKARLITAGLVLTKLLILPAVAMAVKGFKMSTTGKPYGKWNKLFDSVYDVTPKSVVAV
jgi:hypothetical protein